MSQTANLQAVPSLSKKTLEKVKKVLDKNRHVRIMASDSVSKPNGKYEPR
jgi:hypothetical protein